MEERSELFNKKTGAERLINVFQKYITQIIIVLVCLGYILYGLVVIDETGKSPQEIIAEGALSLGMGLIISTLLGNLGTEKGLCSFNYVTAIGGYNNMIEKISHKSNRLDDWCEQKVKQIIRRKQTRILTRVCLSYELFIRQGYNSDVTLNKEQFKAIIKCYNVKVYGMTAMELLSNCSEEEITDKPNLTLNKYAKGRLIKSTFLKIIFAVIFGYFGVTLAQEANYANVIWHLFQIIIWLGLGTVEYFNRFGFVVRRYTDQIIAKTNYLKEFDNDIN